MRELQKEIIAYEHVQPEIDPKKEIRRSIDFLKDYLKVNPFLKSYVLGISGGQDSTLTGKLCQMAMEEMRKETGDDSYQFIAVRLPYGVQADADDAADAVAFETSPAQMRTYKRIIDISGYVEPFDEEELRFRSTGAVTAVYVKEGDKVRKGDLLASIDDTKQTASLQSIRNSIEEAELSGSKRELELLKLQEISAEADLEYTSLRATFDGEVASVDVSAEDYFEAGDSVMTIVDCSKLKATVEIDEIDMPYVYEGQKAMLIFEAYPQSPVEAVVDYIPMLGRYTDQGIGVVDAELLIENPPLGIIPGFTFEGTLESESETEMLLIPYAAVTRGIGGRETVTVMADDGSLQEREIRAEYLGEGYAEVLEGDISEGDLIVIRRGSR